jgi:hypothetical protein
MANSTTGERAEFLVYDTGFVSRLSVAVTSNNRSTAAGGSIFFEVVKNGIVVDTLEVTRAMGLGVFVSPGRIAVLPGDLIRVQVTRGSISTGTLTANTLSLCVEATGAAASPLVCNTNGTTSTSDGRGALIYGPTQTNGWTVAASAPLASMAIGFNARLSRFAIYAMTTGNGAILNLVLNGAEIPVLEIPAGGPVGWYFSDPTLEIDVLASDLVRYSVTGATSGAPNTSGPQCRCQYLSG